ncbi:hypothetical protein [Methanocella arvoryzae]|uniref:Uncharacterized protein n=1 Tax=Methanocella arvoryzae (strain DSM 22066 / NBRC 105507 / MRE50) TaxID=351160 RepID=Q0W6U4_METAR|nr:hypothetical protein [Methanocella arvoryzae]CAJ35899.1 hypothetical protein RCIX470 [Methanocella arvoryzae MRE50]
MQLPRGTLEKSFRGPGTLASVAEGIAKDSLTGYLRVSILSDNVSECVAVYLSGKPVMSFTSAAGDDLPDPGMARIKESIQQPDCLIEICKLGINQVALIQELYGDFACGEPLPPRQNQAAPPAPPQAPPRPAPIAPAATSPAAARFVKPEIRGRFVRSERLDDLREYCQRYPDDTGHLLFIADDTKEEHHAIIAAGRIEAVYDDRGIVPGVPDWLDGVPGIAEFYAVEPGVLTSVLVRSLKSVQDTAAQKHQAASHSIASAVPKKPLAAAPPVPAPNRQPAIGIPAKAILEKTRHPAEAAPAVEDDISRTVDELSRSMDDDIAMVRKVEQDFAQHADELLEKLDLGHLRKYRRN